MSDSTSRQSPTTLVFKILGGLLAFALASASVGVLTATLAVPAVKATGVVTDEASALFEALPTSLEEKELSQQSRMWASDGSLLATFYFRSEGTRLNSSHVAISYAVFCLKKKNTMSTHSY